MTPPRPDRLDPDRIEKALLFAAFSWFAARMIAAYLETRTLIGLLYLVDQACVIGFVLFRRRTDAISRQPADWIAGFAGTFLPLLLIPANTPALVPMAACWGLILAGFAMHLAAKLTLRRSFGVIAANRGVKLSGPYRLVRHPMYSGYILSQLGLVLSGPSLGNFAIVACLWGLQVCRILAEERILSDDANYRDLMRRTPYRLVPGMF